MVAPTYDLDLMLEQREENPTKPLDDRYMRNAAVLPDLPDLPHGREVVQNQDKTFSSPLMIHGFTVADYQRTYHSVVDPLLFGPCGKIVPYNVKLGFTIKEHLFSELAYPSLQISECPNGKVEVTERFCVLRPTPFIDIDKKGEPC